MNPLIQLLAGSLLASVLIGIILFLLDALLLFGTGKMLKLKSPNLRFKECAWILLITGIVGGLMLGILEMIFESSTNVLLVLSLFVPLGVFFYLIRKRFQTTTLQAIIMIVIFLAVNIGVSYAKDYLFLQWAINASESAIEEVDELEPPEGDSDAWISKFSNKVECPYLSVEDAEELLPDYTFENWHYGDSALYDDYIVCTLRDATSEEVYEVYMLEINLYESSEDEAKKKIDTMKDLAANAREIDAMPNAYISENDVNLNLFAIDGARYLSIQLRKLPNYQIFYNSGAIEKYEEALIKIANRALSQFEDEKGAEMEEGIDRGEENDGEYSGFLGNRQPDPVGAATGAKYEVVFDLPADWTKGGDYFKGWDSIIAGYHKDVEDDYEIGKTGYITVSEVENTDNLYLEDYFQAQYEKCMETATPLTGDEDLPISDCWMYQYDISEWEESVLNGRPVWRSPEYGIPESGAGEEYRYIGLGDKFVKITATYLYGNGDPIVSNIIDSGKLAWY